MLSSLFSIKRAWLLAIAFAFAAPAVYAQTDPTNQINWPLTTITGSDTPIQACSAGNYGQPFQRTDVTPNKFGTCGADGWQYRGSGSGSGGVGAHTYSSCPAATGSSSELMVMTVSSTCAMPLPAIVAGYNVAVQTSTSAAVSIAPPGGVTLYVAGVSASTLTIPNGQTVFVTTDGTSYYSTAPAVAGSGITITPGTTGNIYTATGSGIGLPSCSDTSGSGTAQSCSTSPTFTPAANQNCILYHTTTTNTGTGLTVNVNSLGAKPVAITGASGWTTTLTAGVLPSSKPLAMCYDGTNWDVLQTGTAASGGGGAPSGTGVPQVVSGSFGTTVDMGTTANVPLVSDGSHHPALATGTISTGGTGASLLNLTTTTIAGLAGITTGAGYTLTAGSSMADVTDGATCGDTTVGGGTVDELLRCSTVSGGSCTAWTAVQCIQPSPTGYVFSYSTYLGSAATTISFTSIPATAHRLHLSCDLRGDNSSNVVSAQISFNGDNSSTNYNEQSIEANNATLVSAFYGSLAQFGAGADDGVIPALNALTSYMGTVDLLVPNYRSPGFKGALLVYSGFGTTLPTKSWYQTYRVNWLSTSAVTRVDIKASAGNWITGSGCSMTGEL